ncbi:MAG TPA: mobilization protein [Steroidobacteraceae bacterium]
MAAKIEEKIQTLEERLRQLKAKQQRLAARKRTLESRRSRRDDTRRKILVGAIVLAKVEQGVIQESILQGWLDDALTRADDRSLFGLQ